MTRARDDRAVAPRRATRTALSWAGQAVLLGAVYFGITSWRERGLLEAERAAPPFSLSDLEGGTVALEQYRGKRVLLHFWATWCGVCRREFDALNAVQHSLTNDEVLVSIVADAEDPVAVREFAREHGLAYPVLLAEESTLRDYKIGAFPTNYFLDANGQVRDRTVGMSTRWALSARLDWARR